MPWGESLRVGLQLTVAGMGLVFLLLALLWLLLTVMLRADRPAPEPLAAEASAGEPAEPVHAPGPPGPLLTAITVAVLTHRTVQRKQAAPSMRSHWPGSLLYASRWVAAGRHVQNQTWHPRQR